MIDCLANLARKDRLRRGCRCDCRDCRDVDAINYCPDCRGRCQKANGGKYCPATALGENPARYQADKEAVRQKALAVAKRGRSESEESETKAKTITEEPNKRRRRQDGEEEEEESENESEEPNKRRRRIGNESQDDNGNDEDTTKKTS